MNSCLGFIHFGHRAGAGVGAALLVVLAVVAIVLLVGGVGQSGKSTS